MSKGIKSEKSSGNIFADLGLAGAKDMYIKSLLALKINGIIGKRGLKQKEAAEILGITQGRFSTLSTGHKLKDFSIDSLMMFLTKLDQDIEIIVKRKARSHTAGEISVAM